jgi:hypothetical protein
MNNLLANLPPHSVAITIITNLPRPALLLHSKALQILPRLLLHQQAFTFHLINNLTFLALPFSPTVMPPLHLRHLHPVLTR